MEGYVEVLAVAIGGGRAHPIVVVSALSNPGDGDMDGGFARGGNGAAIANHSGSRGGDGAKI